MLRGRDHHFSTLTFLSGDFEMLAGNLASIGVGAIIATVSSLIVCHIFLQFFLSLPAHISGVVARRFRLESYPSY
jgi:hypothetical protein